jgi:heat shock protein HslJ
MILRMAIHDSRAGIFRRLAFGGLIAGAALAPSCLLRGQAATGTSVSTAAPQTALKETHWNLVELNGNPVSSPSPASQPYIYLHGDGDKLSGSGGCNRLFGSFDLSGDSLEFHSVASTRMECADDSMEYEQALLEGLKLVTKYQITGDTLVLRVDDRVVAKFRVDQSH